MVSLAAIAAVVLALFSSLIVLIVVRFVVAPYRLYRNLVNQKLPHSSFVPFIGHMPEVSAAQRAGRMPSFMWKQYEQYGPVWVDNLGPMIQLKVNEPRYLSAVLRSNERLFHRAKLTRAFLTPIIGQHNLLLEEGSMHALHRRMIAPSFRHENLMDMVELMARDARKHVSDWLSEIDGTADDATVEVDLHRALSSLTLDVISACAFGEGLRKIPMASTIVYRAFQSAIHAIQWRFHRFVEFIPIVKDLPILKKPMVTQSRNDMVALVDQVIRDRKAGRTSSAYQNKNDLLDLLLEARDEATGRTLSSEEVRDEALTMVLAGHETTSAALTWTLFVLMHVKPELWEAVAEEVDSVCGPDATPNALQLDKLKLTEAVLLETMRLWPPAPILAREVVEEHELSAKGLPSVWLPKGTAIHISIVVIHRLKEYWGDNAHEFDHTRWLGASRPNIHPYQFMPFSHGPRQCIGQNFAMLEAKCLLAVIVQQCKMSFVPGQELVDGMPTQVVAVTMRPKHAVRVALGKRTQQV